jgi:hypothetical protein
MLELIVLVLFFLSSRFTEWAVLAIIVVYGIWAIYMKTHQPEVWLKIQEAEDRRRAKFCAALAKGCTETCQWIADWITP